MPPKPSPTLTDAELRVMRILWERGASTVQDAQDALPADDRIAYSSVLTTLRILEQKGFARRRKEGRAHVYEAVLRPGDARRSALRFVLDRFFDNSPQLLLAGMFEDEELGRADLEEIRRMIENAESADSGPTNRTSEPTDEVTP